MKVEFICALIRFGVRHQDVPKTILREDHNTDITVTPRGLTSVVQPLDVCLNKPFEDHLRVKWTHWMLEGEKTYTVGGNTRAASLETVYQWVKESNNIIKSVLILGIRQVW